MTTSINGVKYYNGRTLVPVQQQQEANKPFAITMSTPGIAYRDITPATDTITTTNNNSTAADGKDDGSIGFFAAAGNLLKGVGNFFKGMICDENGDFSIGQTLKTALMAGAVAAATFIPVIGPLVVPTLCAVGMVHGGSKALTGLGTVMSAKTDAEAEKAWQDIGSGATEGLISYYGYKASGGLKQGWETAKADYSTLKAEWKAGSSETVDTAKLVETTDGAGAKPTTETTKTEAPKTEAKPAEVTSKNENIGSKTRRDILNEQARKVDAGESTNPTNAEIAEQGKNLNTESLNAKDRALVEDAYKDVPTAEQQLAYDKSIRYEAAKAEDVAAAESKGVKFVEQEGPNATQSMQDVKGADKLQELSQSLEQTTSKSISDGTYVDGTNTYTVKNNKVVQYQVKGNGPVRNLQTVEKLVAKRNVLERIQSGEIKSAPKAQAPAPQAQAVETPVANASAAEMSTPQISQAKINTNEVQLSGRNQRLFGEGSAWNLHRQVKVEAPVAETPVANTSVAKMSTPQVSQAKVNTNEVQLSGRNQRLFGEGSAWNLRRQVKVDASVA